MSAPIDLTHPLHQGIPVWPGHPEYSHTLVSCYTKGDASRVFELGMGEHTGTHLDAPVHWVPGGADIAAAPLNTMYGRAAILGPQRDSIDVFESVNGPITAGDRVLIDCGWARHWATPRYFTDWPAVEFALIEELVARDVSLVAVDTPSPDAADSAECPIHRLLLGRGILIGENFTGLTQLGGFVDVLIAPLPIVDGSGSPVRAIAYP
ncbi:MAG: cyclase family protein [Gordonia sp. (in: high G+C Gram-positive bacteria)]